MPITTFVRYYAVPNFMPFLGGSHKNVIGVFLCYDVNTQYANLEARVQKCCCNITEVTG
jgi:hypothetical protein